jgi:hypothetical protein
MSLTSRLERVLDADMKLLGAHREPHAPSHTQRLWLLDLGEPEQLAEEPAGRWLTTGWSGNLHVVYADDAHQTLSGYISGQPGLVHTSSDASPGLVGASPAPSSLARCCRPVFSSSGFSRCRRSK